MKIGFTTNVSRLSDYENEITQIFSDVKFIKERDFHNFINEKIKHIYIHANYTFNLLKENTFYNIHNDVIFLNALEMKTGIVIHLPKKDNNINNQFTLIISNLITILEKYFIKNNLFIILETDSNINHIGSTIDDLAFIYNNINQNYKKYIKFCIDTSHLFLAGYPIYDFKELLEYILEFEIKIGLKNVVLIHLNDIDSQQLGHHNKHLKIKDGIIFNDRNLSLVINLAHTFDIDIILERTESSFEINNQEISDLKKIVPRNIKNYITYNILLKYFKFKLDVFDVLNDKINIVLLNKQFNTLKYQNHNIIIDFSKNDDVDLIMKGNYKPLLDVPEKYIFITDLCKKLYFNKNKAGELYDIDSNIENLKNLSLVKLKKLLTTNQIQSLKYYDKGNLSINFADTIVNEIHTLQLSDVFFLGSYFRYYNELDKNRKVFQNKNEVFISDIDILIVSYGDSDIISKLKNKFTIKHFFIDGKERKKILCYYKKKHFCLDLFFCLPEDKIAYLIFLKNSTLKNIILRKIAKSKGFRLTEKGLYDKDNNKIYFESEEKLYEMLNVKFKKKV